jgi:hypothetical protein
MPFHRSIAIAVASLICAASTSATGQTAAPAAPSTQPAAPARLVGTLRDIEVVPNMPGARCGNHLELTLASGGKPIALKIYDPTVNGKSLMPLMGKQIEVDLVGGTIVSGLRAVAAKSPSAALQNLSTRRMC